MTIAVAQMQIKNADPAANLAVMLEHIASARADRAELLIFPELCISGLFPGDLLDNAAFVEQCGQANQRIADAAGDLTVIYGNISCEQGKVFNSVFVARQGRSTRVPAPSGQPWAAPAGAGLDSSADAQVLPLRLSGQTLRIGLLLGDWRKRELPYAPREVDLLIDLCSRPLFLADHGPALCAPGYQTLAVNGAGLQNCGSDNYLLAGGSCLHDAQGQLSAAAPLLRDGLFLWEQQGNAVAAPPTDEQLLNAALVTGVREFMAQINCKRAVIGISGGVDSAIAAGVYTQALGAENVLLVGMPGPFSSAATQELAAEMAAGLGTDFARIPIGAGCDQLLQQLGGSGFRTASGAHQDFVFTTALRENVQARERCRILAAVAAAYGGVFTCNGNKAEVTVGYATFYGDLSGAFAMAADLWKHQVYAESAYLQRLYPAAPFDRIAAIRPSAELSAAQDVTKGLGDPLHYAYHDYLLRSWAEDDDDLSVTLRHYQQGDLDAYLGCAAGLSGELFPTAAEFIADAEYWWSMFRGRSVAKRIQAPPLLALTARPYGEARAQTQAAPYFSDAYLRLKRDVLG